jgi:hypothetical protein
MVMNIFEETNIDEMMEIKVPFTNLVAHVKSVCKPKLQERGCEKCPFLPWVMIIMDVNGWKFNGVYK